MSRLREAMRVTLRSFAELRGEPRLVRVEASFLLFSVAELATWLAMLIYAFQQGGAAAAGVVAALQLLPAAALAPFASLLVDRHRRERVLLLGYLAQAAAMLLVGVALAAKAPDAAVYGLAVLTSCSMVLTRPANGAVLPELCSTPGMLAAANGVAGTLESVGWLVGPAITGLVIALAGDALGPAAVYLLMALLLAVAAAVVAGVRANSPEMTPAERDDGGIRGVAHQLRQGVQAVILLPGPRWLVLMLTSAAVVVGLMDVLVVVLVVDVLSLPEAAVGLFAAVLGAGAVLGGVLALGLAGARRLTGAVVSALVASGLAGCLLAVAPGTVGSLLLLVVAGLGYPLAGAAGRTLLQRSTDALVLGRVFGLLECLYLAALAVGSLLGPLFIGVFGPSGAWAAAGLLLAGLAIVTGPGIRRVDRDTDLDPERLRLARGVPFLAALPSLALERVAATLRAMDAIAGNVVIAEGGVGDSFFIVREGHFVVSQEGHVLRHLGSGDGFGEIALLRNVPRTATVTALDAAKLYRLERDEFQLCVTAFPSSRRVAHASVDRALAASTQVGTGAGPSAGGGRTHDEQGPASLG